MSKYIEYSAYTGCISQYIYCLITCNIKSLLNVPKISHISRKISQVSRFPVKPPHSRDKFVFLPKQPLLELSPPDVLLFNLFLCAIFLTLNSAYLFHSASHATCYCADSFSLLSQHCGRSILEITPQGFLPTE